MYLRKLLPQNYLLYMAQEPCDAPDGSNTCLPEGSVHPLSRSPTMAFRLPSSLLTGNANSQQREGMGMHGLLHVTGVQTHH